MLNEVKKSLPADLAICAAAVTDFKPISKKKNKLKKKKADLKYINFIKNDEIL